MNSLEIKRFVERYDRDGVFKGVFACDNLPVIVEKPALYIINQARKSESGTHWVVLYLDSSNSCYYFDSFGLPATNGFIISHMKKHSTYIYFNKKQLQHISSSKCGQFSCTFAVNLLKNNPISAYLAKFSTNLYINDLIINRMYNYMFN